MGPMLKKHAAEWLRDRAVELEAALVAPEMAEEKLEEAQDREIAELEAKFDLVIVNALLRHLEGDR